MKGNSNDSSFLKRAGLKTIEVAGYVALVLVFVWVMAVYYLAAGAMWVVRSIKSVGSKVDRRYALDWISE